MLQEQTFTLVAAVAKIVIFVSKICSAGFGDRWQTSLKVKVGPSTMDWCKNDIFVEVFDPVGMTNIWSQRYQSFRVVLITEVMKNREAIETVRVQLAWFQFLVLLYRMEGVEVNGFLMLLRLGSTNVPILTTSTSLFGWTRTWYQENRDNLSWTQGCRCSAAVEYSPNDEDVED